MKAILLAMMCCAVSIPSLAANPNIASTSTQITQKINLNTADANALMHSIKGIGAKRAEAIVLYRKTHGLFKSIDDLALVRGLGKTFVKSHNKELHDLFIM
jgi:competence protein ComEA